MKKRNLLWKVAVMGTIPVFGVACVTGVALVAAHWIVTLLIPLVVRLAVPLPLLPPRGNPRPERVGMREN